MTSLEKERIVRRLDKVHCHLREERERQACASGQAKDPKPKRQPVAEGPGSFFFQAGRRVLWADRPRCMDGI